MQEQNIFIRGPEGQLEAVTTQGTQGLAILCHPHPLYGGTMRNKVITTLARVFRDNDIATVRFNYRGVGQSVGRYGEGVGETEDLLAVIRWAETQAAVSKPLWLAGFSFGAYVSLSAACYLKKNIRQLISIAPAVNHAKFAGLNPSCPWLIVQGDKDEIVPVADVEHWLSALDPKPDVFFLPNASHFFDGQLVQLRQLLQQKLILC